MDKPSAAGVVAQYVEGLEGIERHALIEHPRPLLAAAIGECILQELEWMVVEHPHQQHIAGCATCRRIVTLRTWVNGASRHLRSHEG